MRGHELIEINTTDKLNLHPGIPCGFCEVRERMVYSNN